MPITPEEMMITEHIRMYHFSNAVLANQEPRVKRLREMSHAAYERHDFDRCDMIARVYNNVRRTVHARLARYRAQRGIVHCDAPYRRNLR